MIEIAHNPLDYAAFTQKYTLSPLETTMIEKMNSSSNEINYSTTSELKFELELRGNIVKAARDLSRSRFAFRVFRNSFCNEDYWERTREGGFRLRSDVKPSDAIKDIYINSRKYGTECATAMVIVYYKAVVDTYPAQLFDSIFRRIYLMDWQHLDPQLRIQTIDPGMIELPGDCRYIKNPDVDPLTPEFQGENLIDLGDGYYYGHGVGIATKERVIAILNTKRKAGSTVSAYLMDQVTNPGYRHLAAKLQE